jgi:hypothetical protein
LQAVVLWQCREADMGVQPIGDDGLRPRRRAATLGALTLAALGCGCGGGDENEPGRAQRESAQAAAPLFDAQGRVLPSPASAAPKNPAAGTRLRLYASAAQYEREELTSGPYTILLDRDALGSEGAAVDQAVQIRGWRSDPDSVAFFIRARRPADAASLADALAYRGFARVFVLVDRS